MKKLLFTIVLLASCQIISFAQARAPQIGGKDVFKNEDVVFHQIDEHTWVGT